MSSRSRPRVPLQSVFPFEHAKLVHVLLGDCRGLRHLTGSRDVLHEILQWGEMDMRSSQCTVNKALEKVCNAMCMTFGPSLHPRFWRAVKGICGGNNASRYKDLAARRLHPYAACMMGDVVVDEVTYGDPAWVIASESWLPSARIRTEAKDPQEDMRRAMNFYIVEAVVHHQLEHPSVWKHVPDFNPIFVALSLAAKSSSQTFTAETASHFACMAVRYETDESRSGSAAFKGLRRWRNVSSTTVAQLTLNSVWGRHKATLRHHQLWHLYRIVNEQGLQDMRSTFTEAIFVLLVTVVHDLSFASIPPEHAAGCVVNALFTKHSPTPKQTFDLSRILYAIRQPRSPYLSVLFPTESQIPVEVWEQKLSLPSAPPCR
jgi:hypothetical protein